MINEVLAAGRQVIVLIPEISLTYQTVRRFYERFGERIAVINSRMSKGERVRPVRESGQVRQMLSLGHVRLCLLQQNGWGLIVIDEEFMMEPTKVILPQSIMQGKLLFIGLSFVEPVLFWVLLLLL